MGKYNREDLFKVYDGVCGTAVALCQLTRELVGGQPADEEAIRAFARFQLKLPEDQIDAAVRRIMQEEIGERDTTPEGGEVKERESYGVNVVRRDEFGPWVGDWQVKAAIKQAASRLGLFTSKRGTKGDVAEMGRVVAIGKSLCGPPERIHLVDESENEPAKTFYQKFMGRVQTPSGPRSIVSDAECVQVGSKIRFKFQWFDAKLSEADIVSIFAALQVVGLGSAKAMERGKFDVLELEVSMKKEKKKAVEGEA